MEINKLGIGISLGLVLSGVQLSYAQQPSETTETYGDWTFRCSQVAAQTTDASETENTNTSEGEATKACETTQVLRDGNGNVIAQIAFGQDPSNSEKIVTVFQVPQGTLLTSPVRFGDEELTKYLDADYFTCIQSICLARAETDEAKLKDIGSVEKGSLIFTDRSGRNIRVLFSFKGLNDAIERMVSAQ